MEQQKSKINSKWLLFAAVIVGLALIILPSLFDFGKKSTEQSPDVVTVTYYTEQLENRIKNLITQVNGIDRASVFITLENTGEYVYAQNKSEGNGNQSADYVIIKGEKGDEAIRLTEIYPVVRGVAVVCSGGNDVAVQQKLISLLSSALGVASNRITVTG